MRPRLSPSGPRTAEVTCFNAAHPASLPDPRNRQNECVRQSLPFIAAHRRRLQPSRAPPARGQGSGVPSAWIGCVRDGLHHPGRRSLEADEIVQVTAGRGAGTAVLLRRGMRVSWDLSAASTPNGTAGSRARGRLRKAQADQGRAEAELQRREELARESLVSTEELNRARGERDRLGAEASSMQAAWNIALQNVRRAEVSAPAGGVINTKKIEKGQWAKQGDVLATIVDISRLRLRFKVSEGESLRAGRNQPITFKVSSLGNARFEGRIYHVGEVADPATRQVEVLAWVTNPGVLKPGFFAEVELASETHKAAIVVPERAVQASRGSSTYWSRTARPARARSRSACAPVTAGRDPRGVEAGRDRGLEGNDRVADGIPVTIAGASPAAAVDPAGGASAGAGR